MAVLCRGGQERALGSEHLRVVCALEREALELLLAKHLGKLRLRERVAAGLLGLHLAGLGKAGLLRRARAESAQGRRLRARGAHERARSAERRRTGSAGLLARGLRGHRRGLHGAEDHAALLFHRGVFGRLVALLETRRHVLGVHAREGLGVGAEGARADGHLAPILPGRLLALALGGVLRGEFSCEIVGHRDHLLRVSGRRRMPPSGSISSARPMSWGPSPLVAPEGAASYTSILTACVFCVPTCRRTCSG